MRRARTLPLPALLAGSLGCQQDGTCSVNSLRDLHSNPQVLLEITALLQLFMQVIACHRCDELLDKPVKAAALH